MIIRFIAFALTLLLLTPGSVLSVIADDVGESAQVKAARAKAHAERKAQGLVPDNANQRGARAGQRQQQQEQQQAMQRAKRCQDAIKDEQNTAVGTSVLSGAVGFLPFGGAASGVASAAAGMGATVGGEIARQKAAAAVQGNC